MLRDRAMQLEEPKEVPRRTRPRVVRLLVSDEQKARIEKVAKAYGVSVSALVRAEIRKIIKENPAP